MMLSVKNLVLGYNNKTLTQPFSLDISKNKWVGIIGQNGIGKSTFFKNILGLLKPVSGEISVFGDKPGKYNSEISYIPQQRSVNLTKNMTGLSLIKNSYKGWRWGVGFKKSSLNKDILEIIDLVGARDYINQAFFTLSGGQKKRIYLAQALINNPKLLLLDEPLADLDPKAKQHFIKSLKSIHESRELSLLIISHDMHEIAKHLDGFIHFKDSKVHQCVNLPCIKEDVYV
jgi:zinc/manganese transport system ATP-binding protein